MLQVTLKEVIHCQDDVSTNEDFPTLESNGEQCVMYCTNDYCCVSVAYY